MIKWGGNENTIILKCICPTSGEISLGEIRQELESTSNSDDYGNGPYTTNQTSLKDCNTFQYDNRNTNSSSYPNASTPHQMSEFYSYHHNATDEMK